MKEKEQLEIPIQPVEQPIICKPFEEPNQHWFYDTKNGTASLQTGRRPASYWYKSRRTGSTQLGLFAEEEREDLPLVNLIRDDVRRWRKSNYEGATHITKQLLAYWNREDRYRKLFFCQLEAVETIIYLREIFSSGKKTRWNTALSFEDYNRLLKNEKPSFIVDETLSQIPRLIDIPNEIDLPGLIRYGCKMATGSGKTVVMAMLIAWSFCNKGRVPGDDRFTSAALVVCPNLTIKERLQVLRPDIANNYYEEFDLVPSQLLAELRKGKVLVTNWHQFAPESPNVESGKSYLIVDKGEEGPDAFAKRILSDLYDYSPIMVLNDEAHHAYRPAPQIDETLTPEEKADLEEATVWISGLDRINKAVGVKFCVDLSATPFYIQGSGYTEGMPFPWLVSDFGLVDAIESGLVKIPRIPVSDTTGRPEPKYFALWKHIMDNLQPGERFTSGKPKPDAVWREAQDAITTLASQWKEKFEYVLDASEGKDKTPPVMIVVCDNTDIAELFYKKISGEEKIIVDDSNDEEENDDTDEEVSVNKKKSRKKEKKVYGTGSLFPELLSNTENFSPTLRIDSKLLAQAESEDPKVSKKDSANQLREIVSTIGKLGKPGEQIRCVISVQMLTEGWDANNVTQILGLRAFHSQLLCEQVVGRGLRRMDYTLNADGYFNPEYVDIYGVPFSVIPFRGRKTTSKAPEDKPLNHVRALEERRHYEIKFPIVEGYAFALKHNLIRADVEKMEKLVVEPSKNPIATFVKPQVYYEMGTPKGINPFEYQEHDREEYYKSTHLQTIIFEISRRIVTALTEGIGNQSAKLQLKSRQQLFPQVFEIVTNFVKTKIDFRGVDPREIGLEVYAEQIVERLLNAIEPDSSQGEPPLLPILNRYRQIGSTSEVSFKTVKRTVFTSRSHIDQVVCDTNTWEEIAAFQLERAKEVVKCYVKNDHLEFTIPYEYFGASHAFTPDFLVKLKDDSTLILEIKGQEDDQDRAKHEATKRWIKAVNNWGKLGIWKFHICRDPQLLISELEKI